MLDTKEELTNLVIYCVINYLLLGVQSSLWPEFFGSFPAPMFLLYSLIFFALYHPPKWVYVFVGISLVLFTAFSAVPIEIYLFLLILITTSLQLLKKRVFWQGVTYYMLCSFIAIFLFHLGYYILSWGLEIDEAGKAHIQWGFWILQSLTTLILSPIFYWFYIQIESATRGFDTSDVEEAL